MDTKIQLKEWQYAGMYVKLTYEDDSVLYVRRKDFNRAFGCIIGLTKVQCKRDFAVPHREMCSDC